jgi:thiol:disulfide interchange protein DsbA
MNCSRIDSLLDSHGPETLTPPERAEIAAHVARCERCADAWLGHDALVGEVLPAPRPGFYDELLATTMRPDTASAAAPSRRLVQAAGIAAAAAIALAAVWFGRHGGDSPAPALARDSATLAAPSAPHVPSAVPAGPRFVAGTHYELLAAQAPTTAAPGHVEVVEFFMWPCIHCFNFEPELRAWLDGQPDNVDFRRVPVFFNDLARLHARVFYALDELGQVDALMVPIFEAVHLRGNPLASREDLREFMLHHGIDPASFDRAFDSDAVQARVAGAEELNRVYRVTATPSLAVNGWYLTNAGMTGSYDEMFELVDRLIEAEAATGPCAGRDGVCDRSLRLREIGARVSDLVPGASAAASAPVPPSRAAARD